MAATADIAKNGEWRVMRGTFVIAPRAGRRRAMCASESTGYRPPTRRSNRGPERAAGAVSRLLRARPIATATRAACLRQIPVRQASPAVCAAGGRALARICGDPG
ncbi:Uncharacterised protein [Burkholderia pseudomallei]|nr:Uncharacterised protein [Burkholderia pseudomallei]CAJ5644385.1 Uncharacterised protein [Burkholderia pseudomallei]CAJ8381256.1 Uncharacterised protein [Burkholderia pseudomallei]CAJ8661931.1 Uncharacterised protein [Burkholderia pseudomallei]CAK0196380.1 Uncharacterised protein [Burkholderia pseudomallei]